MGKRGKQRDWVRIKAVADTYLELGSVVKVAERFNVTHQAIAYSLQLAGVPIKNRNALTDKFDEVVARCHELRSIPKVAAEYGISKNTLYWKLREEGIRIKPLRDPEALFWSRIKKGADGDCWYWSGSVHKTGYGTLSLRRQQWYAHRLAWCLVNDATPDPSLEVAHLCGIKTCCNPKHLKLVTKDENLSHRAIHKIHGHGAHVVAEFV